MPGESLAHLLPAAFRVALGLPPVAAGSDASGGSSHSEEDGEVDDGDGGQGRYRCLGGNSHQEQGRERALVGIFRAIWARESRWGMMGGRKKVI
jgi:hypothetical protein